MLVPLLTPAHSAPKLALALGGKIEMRIFSRACLVAILAVGLLNIPAFAANDTPLGMIIQAEGLAHLGAAKAAIGSTVYPGDSVFTEAGSTMRMRVGSSQVYLLSESG